MVVATTATKRITAEAMPAMVLGLETKNRSSHLPTLREEVLTVLPPTPGQQATTAC